MTSTADGYRGEPASWINRFRLLIGHHGSTTASWLSLIFSIRIITGIWFPDVSRAINLPFFIVFAGVTAATMWGTSLHKRTMCEREANNISVVLDPQAAVENNRRRLKVYHQFSATSPRRRVFLAVGLGIVAAVFGLQQVWPLGGDILATALVGAVSPFLFYLDFAGRTHRELYPWCPYCRHGGRGPRNRQAPRPDPAGQKA